AYGWDVIGEVDGHNVDALDYAIRQAKAQTNRPSLICCKTVIGQGAPSKAGGHEVHGAPLGAQEMAMMREQKKWGVAPFEVPVGLKATWDARASGQARQAEWENDFAAYRATYPELAAELVRRMAGDLPKELSDKFFELIHTPGELHKKVATRKASQIVLEHITATLPEFFGGSADLTASNLTNVKASVWVNHHGSGNYLSYGVREFGMAAMMNGMALYGGFIPYGGTFMTFSDYSRNAIRMAALMKQRVIHVLTHDSIGLGEDGPTHQPVEHAASLRMIPNNRLWRPCDGVETAIAWQAAITRLDGPSCLVLSRQALPSFVRSPEQVSNIARGGYILIDHPQPQVIMIATGSEVAIAAQAAEQLGQRGVSARVVSMPCVELFYAQDASYRKHVLPDGVPRVSIEAGVTWFWRAVVGESGIAIGIDRFGESAPAEQLYEHFGLTPAHVVKCALSLIEES
ncbi:MAG: transketolase, partial [Burkholderiaceae bacterium]|nr:transketolase [Burkholderiaceae bacterium]